MRGKAKKLRIFRLKASTGRVFGKRDFWYIGVAKARNGGVYADAPEAQPQGGNTMTAISRGRPQGTRQLRTKSQAKSFHHRMSNSRPEHMDDSSTLAGNHEG
jgi:hypothetical protein